MVYSRYWLMTLKADLRFIVKILLRQVGDKTLLLQDRDVVFVSDIHYAGDVLLSAGFIAYLGPYTVNYRRELVTMWNQRTKELSKTTQLNINYAYFL